MTVAVMYRQLVVAKTKNFNIIPQDVEKYLSEFRRKMIAAYMLAKHDVAYPRISGIKFRLI
jgi:hypothetical protein